MIITHRVATTYSVYRETTSIHVHGLFDMFFCIVLYTDVSITQERCTMYVGSKLPQYTSTVVGALTNISYHMCACYWGCV